MRDTDREARLEEIEQDFDAYKAGDAVDVQIKAVDRRGDAGPAIVFYRKAPHYVLWLLSEIDRLDDQLHRAEAIGDFPAELRSRRRLEDENRRLKAKLEGEDG